MPLRYSDVFCRIRAWILFQRRSEESVGGGLQEGGRFNAALALALALNVHYSPIIKSDKLTLPDWKFPVNTAN